MPFVPANAGAGMSGRGATVERRPAVAKAMAGYSPARRSFSEGGEASVPRHKRVHARLVTQDGVSHGCLARTRTSLGAPPTPRFG